jgi:hypothetical protein
VPEGKIICSALTAPARSGKARLFRKRSTDVVVASALASSGIKAIAVPAALARQAL